MTELRIKPYRVNEEKKNETFVQHVYDLDIVRIYKDLEIVLSHKKIIDKRINKKEYLENIREKIEDYCAKYSFDYDHHINTGNVVINSEDSQYFFFLGLRLITCELNEVCRTLTYQNEKYTNKKTPFINLLMFRVTQVIKNNFNEIFAEKRINQIDKWINESKFQNDILNRISQLSTEKKSKLVKISEISILNEEGLIAIPNVKPLEIRAFFEPLTSNVSKNGKLFMQQDELEYLLGNNFQGFKTPAKQRKLKPNMIQVQIYYVFAKFYRKFIIPNFKKSKPLVAKLIKNNFALFDETDEAIIYKNFNKNIERQYYLFKDILK